MAKQLTENQTEKTAQEPNNNSNKPDYTKATYDIGKKLHQNHKTSSDSNICPKQNTRRINTPPRRTT